MPNGTSSTRASREVVDFPANTPVTVALKYGHGKTISNQHGERMMYSLADGRVMFLDLEVASQISAAGINVRELFTITRRTSGERGRAATWEVSRVPGEQPNGTFVVPDGTSKTTADASLIPRKAPASALVDEANALVDTFVQVLERSLTLHQGRVKPDEVKALVVTAYIQRNKLSSVA